MKMVASAKLHKAQAAIEGMLPYERRLSHILGLLLASMGEIFIIMAYVGCACFGLSTVFQLVTLPTEFNASNRALRTIEETNLLQGEELKQAKQVLSAAAMTYVAALAVSLAQLLRFLIIVGGRRRN